MLDGRGEGSAPQGISVNDDCVSSFRWYPRFSCQLGAFQSFSKGPQKHPTEWRPLLCNYVAIVLYGQKPQYQGIVGCGLGGPKRLDTAGIFLLRPNFQAYNVSCGPGCAWPVIKSRSLDVPHKKI